MDGGGEMPRKAEYIPRIEAEFRRAKKPITTQVIAEKLGCSNQQVHKAISGQLRRNVVRVGTSDTGGYTYAWRDSGDDDDDMAGKLTKAAHVELGDTWTVIEVNASRTGTSVVLENRAGDRITARS